jgi:hypothetical protein
LASELAKSANMAQQKISSSIVWGSELHAEFKTVDKSCKKVHTKEVTDLALFVQTTKIKIKTCF